MPALCKRRNADFSTACMKTHAEENFTSIKQGAASRLLKMLLV